MRLNKSFFNTGIVFAVLLTLLSSCQQEETKALITTEYGDITILLYDSTPKHRDNFIKLANEGFYDSLLFHRVIKEFMIQGGDPNSKNAEPGKALGMGSVGYRVPAEFRTSLFHKKGVIAAARDNNPEKASSGCQFYITQGRVFSEGGLDSLENFRLRRKIPAAQREVYKTIGGVPHLDQNYTVFGEVIKGLEVVDSIAAVETSKGMDTDRPLQNIMIIRAKLVKRKKNKR